MGGVGAGGAKSKQQNRKRPGEAPHPGRCLRAGKKPPAQQNFVAAASRVLKATLMTIMRGVLSGKTRRHLVKWSRPGATRPQDRVEVWPGSDSSKVEVERSHPVGESCGGTGE